MPPTTRPGDFAVGGQWLLLARDRQGGRAWSRTGVADVPTRRNINDTMYGNVADTLDHPEVSDDWSGGFGDAYETPDRPNTYHWATGWDLRFPRQGVHAQAPQLLSSAAYASINKNAYGFLDIPRGAGFAQTPGAGWLLVYGRGFVGALFPSRYHTTEASAFAVSMVTAGFGTTAFADRGAVYGSYAYIPNVSGTGVLRVGFGLGVDATFGPQTMRWLAPADGRLWFAIDRTHVRSVGPEQDPLATGNYAATLFVGNGLPLRDAVAIDDQLYIGAPDGVYQGNLSGTFSNIAGDIASQVDLDNASWMSPFQGGLAFAQGPHIWWFKPSSGGNSELREVGPSGLFSNRSRVRGKFTCVRGYGKWLYAGLFTGSSSYFMVGRDASSPLPYVWHPLHDFLGLTCKVSRLHVDNITVDSLSVNATQAIPNRIWAATDPSFGAMPGATAPVYFWPIPPGDSNPLAYPTFSANYMGSARMELPEADWGAPGTSKVWRVAEWQTENLTGTTGQWFQPYFNYYGGGGPQGVILGTLGYVTESPKSATFFPRTAVPAGAGTINFVQGQSLALRVDSFTASPGITPVLRSVLTRGVVRPRSIDTITARARIADGMMDRHGKSMPPAHVQLAKLRTAAHGSGPSWLTDLTGATQLVSVIPPIEEEEFYQQGEDAPEVIATIRMAAMEFTAGASTEQLQIDPPPLF